MKKLISLVIVLAMVLSLSVAAFAEGEATTYEDVSKITITKTYKAVNGGVSPQETFAFGEFTHGDEVGENPAATYPETLPTITSITYAEGAATSDGTGTGTATAEITLPTFTAVGIYTYTFKEVTPTTKTAGVTYNDTTLYLVVTVIEQNGKVRVAAVHCEGSSNTGTYGTSPKTDVFENKYENGSLEVTKTVTGLFGDKTKDFDMKVTFEAPEGYEIKSTIKFSIDDGTEQTYDPSAAVTFSIHHGQKVTFTNIPADVKYTVHEADYTGDNGGYDAVEDATGTISAGNTAEAEIINNKDGTIDTGVILESLPYVVIGLVVAAAVVVLIVRKTRKVED